MYGKTCRGRTRAAHRCVLRVLPVVAMLAILPVETSSAQDASAPEEPGAESGDPFEGAVGPPENVEVIRVRGRGIAPIQTELPSSVTQFDASTIEALGAQDVSDLSRVTPNVNIIQPNATQATFFIRGIGLSDFQSNAAGAVTIFQDDVSLNAPAIQTGQLFDIEGVEIVKGPQGTGPFRNASAGAIRVRSRLPTGNHQAQLRSSIGRYAADGGKGASHGLIQDYEGALEMPVVADLMSTRVAFRLRDAEPFKTNGCGNAPAFADRVVVQGSGANRFNEDQAAICGERDFEMLPVGQVSRIPVGLPDEVQSVHNWAARGTLRLQPPETDFDFVLSFHGSRLDQDPVAGQAIGSGQVNATGLQEQPFTFGGRTAKGYREPDQRQEFDDLCQDVDPTSRVQCSSPGAADLLARHLAQDRPLDRRPFRGDYNRQGELVRDTWGGFGRVETVLFGLDVFALGSFDTYTRTQEVDLDFTPDVLFEQLDYDEAWQTYEEVRIGGELAAEPLEWEVGAWFLQEELDVDASFFLGIPGSRTQPQIDRDYSQKIQSAALWGELAWDVYDDLTLEAGVRYNWERKEFAIRRQDVLPTIAIPPAFAKQRKTWQTPTGEIALRYHLDEAISTYLKYSHGFKAGHFNALPGLVQVASPPAREEYNDAWETGIAGYWLQGLVAAQAAFFYYRYEYYQLFNLRDDPQSPPVLEILNADEAENYGVEFEFRLEPLRAWTPRVIEGLLIQGTFAWLHGEYIDFQLSEPEEFAVGVLPISSDFSGNQLQNSPEYSFSLSAAWTLDLGRYGFLVPRYDMNWSDDVFFNIREGRGLKFPNGSERLPEYAIGQPAFFLHNVRFAYRTPTGNVELAVWARNLEDTVYKTFAADVSKFRGVVLNFVGEPRTIGFDVIVTF